MAEKLTDLSIDVTEWLGTRATVEDATFGSLLLRVHSVPLTEVHDSLAESTRPTIRVPAVRVAEWLVANYWRLRWEARPRKPDLSWQSAHCLASIGEGYAWPALEIAGDGETVDLSLHGETQADVAAIRYLREGRFEVSGRAFDTGVDRFLDRIEGRIGTILPRETSFRDLREELADERNDPDRAHWCRLEARAGIDPGDAPPGWRERVSGLENDAGAVATEDMLAAGGIAEITATVDGMRKSTTKVDLSAAPNQTFTGKPWERGAAAARALRRAIGKSEGPISNDELSSVLGLKVPVDRSIGVTGQIVGGFRARDLLGETRILVPRKGRTGQRFYFARLLGAASAMPRDQAILPITTAGTAFQKVTRSFAQELLCPWAELDEWTDAHGMDEDSIALAAERYEVSELLVTTTLVNRGKLDRERLGAYPASI